MLKALRSSVTDKGCTPQPPAGHCDAVTWIKKGSDWSKGGSILKRVYFTLVPGECDRATMAC